MRRLREQTLAGARDPAHRRGREAERIVGLRRGADDYVVKPFSPGELVARVEAVLRRERPAPPRAPVLEFEGLRIEPATRTVLVGEPRRGAADESEGEEGEGAVDAITDATAREERGRTGCGGGEGARSR